MPKIDRVNISLKISKQIHDDPFTTKSLSLGAEAAISPNETFERASQELYHTLAANLRLLWAEKSQQVGPEGWGDEKTEELPTQPLESPAPPVDPSWCPIHGCKMKKYTKGTSSWYSHKVGDAWCKGKAE